MPFSLLPPGDAHHLRFIDAPANFPSDLCGSSPGQSCSSAIPVRFRSCTHTDEGNVMCRGHTAFFLSGLLTLLLPLAAPASQDTLTVGLWHCDEESGPFLYDASGLGNTINLHGTLSVAGVLGRARHFNGGWDYGALDYPGSQPMDMSDAESFEVSLWVRTTGLDGTLIRRGLAPYPGLMLMMEGGYVRVSIGNREDSSYPDTLISITSLNPVNDGQWHYVSFVRDRESRTVSLKVDGVSANPVVDPITFALASTRQMNLDAGSRRSPRTTSSAISMKCVFESGTTRSGKQTRSCSFVWMTRQAG